MQMKYPPRVAIMAALKMADVTVNASTDEEVQEKIENPDEGEVNISINMDRPENVTEYTPTPQDEMQTEVDKLLLVLDGVKLLCSPAASQIAGVEAMPELLDKALGAVINTGSRFVGLFRTYLFHGFQDFKRGEVTLFRDNNRREYNTFTSMPFDELKNKTIPHPRGLETTFAKADDALSAYLKALDMPSRTKTILATVNSIKKDLLSPNPSFKMSSGTIGRQHFTREIETAFKDTEKCFTKSDKDQDIFSNLFTSTEDFKTQMDNLCDFDSDLRCVSGVYSDMQKLDGLLESITPLSKRLEAKQIDELADCVKLFGVTFSNYATVINDVQRMGHAGLVILEQLKYVKD